MKFYKNSDTDWYIIRAKGYKGIRAKERYDLHTATCVLKYSN